MTSPTPAVGLNELLGRCCSTNLKLLRIMPEEATLVALNVAGSRLEWNRTEKENGNCQKFLLGRYPLGKLIAPARRAAFCEVAYLVLQICLQLA